LTNILCNVCCYYEDIDYDIWNPEDILLGAADTVELWLEEWPSSGENNYD
jgi:hypothetical protein